MKGSDSGFVSSVVCLIEQNQRFLHRRQRIGRGLKTQKYVDHATIGSTEVESDLATQNLFHRTIGTKRVANSRHLSHTFPGRDEVFRDKRNHLWIRERHGPRKMSIGSAELFIHLPKEL